MKGSKIKAIAIQTGPELCVAHREVRDEALVRPAGRTTNDACGILLLIYEGILTPIHHRDPADFDRSTAAATSRPSRAGSRSASWHGVASLPRKSLTLRAAPPGSIGKRRSGTPSCAISSGFARCAASQSRVNTVRNDDESLIEEISPASR